MSTIVSLTSTASRLPFLRHTLQSLLDQSLHGRIQVNLSREPYLMDHGVGRLPRWLREWVDGGRVEVCWTENTGPYRKLLPALERATDSDLVVTCDDDVIYGETWLATLVDHAHRHPDAIVCGHARAPIRNAFGRRQSYVQWPRVTDGEDHPNLLPIGAAGVVYRKGLLDLAFLAWREFLRVAPCQDDLWFREAVARRGTPVRIAPGTDAAVHPIRTGDALSDSNAGGRLRTPWGGLLMPFVERTSYRLRAYLGYEMCENDRVLKTVADASRRFDARAAER